MRENIPYLPPFYIDYLKGFRFDPSEVEITMENHKLHIKASGLLYRITLWETPILATVSELYFKVTGQKARYGVYGEKRLSRKRRE